MVKTIKELDENNVDLICTDPPYGYSFMNKDWDKANTLVLNKGA